MAYRRNVTIRTKFLAQQRFTPSISYLNHNEDRKNQHSDEKLNSFPRTRSYGVYNNNTITSLRDPKWSQFRHVPITTASGFLLVRNMSTSIGDGGGIDKIEYMNYMADVIADKTTEIMSNQASHAVSEVAVAAADSWLPVAGLQYAIDGIHTFTGLNWWASIAITTLIIRTLLVPIMISQLKASTKLTILSPRIEEINQELQEKGMSMAAQTEWQEQRNKLFKEHDVSMFSSMKGILIQGPVFISFFLAINNMVEKVPSFKTGGVSWFLDLTTADTFYILPCLTAFTSWMIVEFNMEQGLDGKSHLMKNVARGFSALSIPIMASLPKGLFCYWITSNLFSLVYGLIIKQESVKKFFNIPIIVPPPPSPNGQPKPAVSFWEGIKKYYDAQAMLHQARDSKPTITNQSMNSSQLLSQKPYSEVKSSNQGVSSSSDLSYGFKNQGKKGKEERRRGGDYEGVIIILSFELTCLFKCITNIYEDSNSIVECRLSNLLPQETQATYNA